jgi:cytochrome c oxidase subunit 2
MPKKNFLHAIVLLAAVYLVGAGAVLADEEIDLEAAATLWKFCAFCHNAGGFGQERSDAPKVAGDPAWYTERQLKNFRARVRGTHPEDQPGLQMIVYAYPLIDAAAIRNMAAYIELLQVDPADPAPDRMARRPRNRPYEWDTILAPVDTGEPADLANGEQLYEACAVCHGATGEGLEEMNAPRLDNKQDWYLHRQLRYFKYGARGVHEDDVYGRQMAEQGTPATDQDIVDVVAYIMTMSQGPMY